MNAPAPNATRTVILAAIDGAPMSGDVLRTAALLGRMLPGAELHLLNVLEPAMGGVEAAMAIPSPSEQIEDARAMLDRTTEEAREHFSGRIVTHLGAGMPWREIVQLATNLRADVIVMGKNRLGRVERWLLGSVCEQVVRKAPCAVIVAKPKEQPRIPEIEPACPDCLAVQRETAGGQLWCAAHTRHASRPAHLHYELPQSYGVGSMLVRPEG